MASPPVLPPSVSPLGREDPAVVGGFRLIGRLGTGGMGTVYAGVSDQGQRVAVKIAHPARPDAERFERELDLMSRVQGVCGVGVHASGEHRGRPWAAIEYVPGVDVSRHVRQSGPLTGQPLLLLAAGCAEALTAIHGAGIAHGDIKPGNVLMAPSGPKVVDYGIARRVDTAPPMGNAGSLGWLAPERYEAAPPDKSSDLFAWACLVVFAATGEPPFGRVPTGTDRRTAVLEMARRARAGDVEMDALPEGLRPILRRALSPDPGERPWAEEVYLECLILLGPEEPEEVPWAERLRGMLGRYWPRIDTGWDRPQRWLSAAATLAATASAAPQVGSALGVADGPIAGPGGPVAAPEGPNPLVPEASGPNPLIPEAPGPQAQPPAEFGGTDAVQSFLESGRSLLPGAPETATAQGTAGTAGSAGGAAGTAGSAGGGAGTGTGAVGPGFPGASGATGSVGSGSAGAGSGTGVAGAGVPGAPGIPGAASMPGVPGVPGVPGAAGAGAGTGAGAAGAGALGTGPFTALVSVFVIGAGAVAGGGYLFLESLIPGTQVAAPQIQVSPGPTPDPSPEPAGPGAVDGPEESEEVVEQAVELTMAAPSFQTFYLAPPGTAGTGGIGVTWYTEDPDPAFVRYHQLEGSGGYTYVLGEEEDDIFYQDVEATVPGPYHRDSERDLFAADEERGKRWAVRELDLILDTGEISYEGESQAPAMEFTDPELLGDADLSGGPGHHYSGTYTMPPPGAGSERTYTFELWIDDEGFPLYLSTFFEEELVVGDSTEPIWLEENRAYARFGEPVEVDLPDESEILPD